MNFANDLQRERDNHLRRHQKRLPTYKCVTDVVTALTDPDHEKPNVIALDMFIAFRERFYGGWNLWLGSKEAANVSPEDRAMLPTTSFPFKATHYFRLSLWTSENPDDSEGRGERDHEHREATDITQIPDGAEIFVGRVTGLKVHKNPQWPNLSQAQGNTSRVEEVMAVEDDDTVTSRAQDEGSQLCSVPKSSLAPQSLDSGSVMVGAMEDRLNTSSINGQPRGESQTNGSAPPTLEQPNEALSSVGQAVDESNNRSHNHSNFTDERALGHILDNQGINHEAPPTAKDTSTNDENYPLNELERTIADGAVTEHDAAKKEGECGTPNSTNGSKKKMIELTPTTDHENYQPLELKRTMDGATDTVCNVSDNERELRDAHVTSGSKKKTVRAKAKKQRVK